MKTNILKLSRRELIILLIGLSIGILFLVFIGSSNKSNNVTPSQLNTGKATKICTQDNDTNDTTLKVENPACDDRSASESATVNSSGSTAAPSNTSKSTQPNSSSFTPPPSASISTKCNEALRTAYTAKRNADIAYENSTHDAFRPNTPYGSSYYDDQVANEAARHSATLSQIEANYQIKLAAANCS